MECKCWRAAFRFSFRETLLSAAIHEIADALLHAGTQSAAKPNPHLPAAMHAKNAHRISDGEIFEEERRQPVQHGLWHFAFAPHLPSPHVDDEISATAEEDQVNEDDNRTASGKAKQQEPGICVVHGVWSWTE
jgi:hypothetical protein